LDTEPFYPILLSFFQIIVHPINISEIVELLILIILLFGVALITGSEIAYFSLTTVNLKQIQEKPTKVNKLILSNLQNPEGLLAALLIANNLLNISIIILSTYLISNIFDFNSPPWFGFVFDVVLITFLILFFGKILPKIYASNKSKSFASFVSYPIFFVINILKPFSYILINSTSFVNKRFQLKKNISIENLSDAINIALQATPEKKEILQGIVKYGSIETQEIMTPRIDVISVDISITFEVLKQIINESGYSRIPVYEETFDNIKGILFAKDLVKHLTKLDFKWSELIREAYYVPETKKLDDLFHEFQEKKIHMAIVSDEYGGISGIITLEDVLEEIVGEINDEFDEVNQNFEKIDANTFIFEGKTQLNDFYKITQTEDDTFDDIKGEAETLAGLILEIRGDFPTQGEIIECKQFIFHIESVDNRKINNIKIVIK